MASLFETPARRIFGGGARMLSGNRQLLSRSAIAVGRISRRRNPPRSHPRKDGGLRCANPPYSTMERRRELHELTFITMAKWSRKFPGMAAWNFLRPAQLEYVP
jgi:hypothetical protein